jgi:protoporphyrinogen oxidase
MRCEEIGAQWAAQRIRGLSLRSAAADMLRRGSGGQRTLVTEFLYPRLGPSMLWERMRARIEAAGGRVLLGHRLLAVRCRGHRVHAVEIEGPGGRAVLDVGGLVSTVPLRDLVGALDPAAPPEVLAAACSLRHRDFLEVALILDGPDPFPDTWLYLHDPDVGAGRLQNFRAWSPELVPDGGRACVGVEYFCQAGDALWRRPDEELVRVARDDLAAIGFAVRVADARVVRQRDAYPVYDDAFIARVAAIRRALAPLANVAVAGRSGMHRYNNMDHSMWTGLLAARRLLGAGDDPWAAGADGEYQEPPLVPADP